MKHLKTLNGLLLTLLLICTSTVFAHDFEKNGIYYNILSESDKTVEVTYKGFLYDEFCVYTGNVVIPEIVSRTDMIFDSWTSTNKNNSTTSQKSYTLKVEAGNILKFDWSVSSEKNYDWLTIMLDGTEIIKKSGTLSGSYEKTFTTTGTHTLIVKYIKDNSSSSGNDEGKIYNITLKGIVGNYRIVGIGEYAFNDCDELTSIEISNSVTSIGNYAFDGCFGLTSIEIPNSVTSIGDRAFSYCTGLTSVMIPEKVTNIGNSVFSGCRNLANITIPNSITSIGANVFNGTAWYANQPDGVIYLGKILYEYKGGMPSNSNTFIKIKDGTLSIAPCAFESCYGLTDIDIPNSVTSIGASAFFDCTGLTSIVIPNSITSIDEDAFGWCNNLKTVINFSNLTFTRSSYSYGDIAYYADKVINAPNGFMAGEFIFVKLNDVNTLVGYIGDRTELILPDDYNGENYIIGERAFYGSHKLVSIIIGNNVTRIASDAFRNCADLTKVSIPNSVASIGDYAFYYCDKLADVCLYSNPKYGTNAIPSTAKCHLILEDSNAIDFDITNANTYADVSYSRHIAEGKFGTIILPFAPNTASLENYAFYELVESGDYYMKFEEVVTPVANTPYIYTLREGKENVAIAGGETTISSTVETPVVDGWQTIGSFTNQALDTSDGNYYAFSPSKNEINKITKNLTVLPYRAYFKSDNASKSAFSVYISGTTGVKEVLSSEIDGFETEVVYDLSGRKILDPVKGGIYIINGKKVKF